MTATIPAQRQAAYRGAVYAIDVIDHDSFMADEPTLVRGDYRGKTRQRGRNRETQHRDRQPFSDLIVGDSRVLWEGVCTEDELDEMERRFIQDTEPRPRLNIALNEDNPEMVPKRVQVQQRWARDDKMGRPRWVPFDQRTRQSLLEWDDRVTGSSGTAQIMPVRQVWITHKWTPPQVKACLWSSSWASMLLVTEAGQHHYGAELSWVQTAAVGTVLHWLLLGWALAGCPRNRRQWRRVVRTRKRRASTGRRR